MPTFDYAAVAAKLLPLLDKYGGTGTLTRKGSPGPLQSDGTVTLTGGGAVTVKMIEIAAGTRMGLVAAGAQSQDGDVRRFNATHLIQAITPDPLTGDTMVFNGKTLSLKDVRTIRPAGTPICHFLECGNP